MAPAGNSGELIGRQYHHGVALQAHPFLVFPDAQLVLMVFRAASQ